MQSPAWYLLPQHKTISDWRQHHGIWEYGQGLQCRITLHYYEYCGQKTVLAPNATLLTETIVKEKWADTRIAARSSVSRYNNNNNNNNICVHLSGSI